MAGDGANRHRAWRAHLRLRDAHVARPGAPYGNDAPNPAERLATLLASMKDGEGRVTVEEKPGRIIRANQTLSDRFCL